MSTENRSDTPIEPSGDSRPVRFDSLLDREKDLIDRTNRLLRGIYEDAKRFQNSSNSSSDPWALIDNDRRHRVLMLSGPRGSGKTSLLLTLLAGWRAAWTKNWNTLASPENQKEVEELFNHMDDVRPLKPLDFDPLPPDLPLYGWIIQAFRPLVDWLTNNGQAIRGIESDHLRSASEQGGRSLPWSENSQSLREQLQKLYQMAIVGWGSGKLREAFQKDLFDLILDQEDQHLNWQRLQSSWQNFLNGLFKELDGRRDIFPQKGLLVLPIDDADLQIERDRELILAIRLLHHPRLVYLLTGDITNLRENLKLEFLGRMVSLSNTKGLDSKVSDINEERSRSLAFALTEKVLPTSHVLGLNRLTLHEALEWSCKKKNQPLDKILLDTAAPETSLQKFIEERPKNLDFDCVLFRRLQQFYDNYGGDSEFPRTDCLADFLEMLENVEDEDEFTVGNIGGDQIVLHTYPGPIVPAARLYQSYRHERNIEVRVGINLEFNQERITTDLSEQSGRNRLVQASPRTLLALDLAADSPRMEVHQHTSRIRSPQCLAWSIWHGDSLETWLPWPSIRASSPTELVKRAEAWTKAVRAINNNGTVEWVDRIAFAWIRLHLVWLGCEEEQFSVAHETSSNITDAWTLLSQILRSMPCKVRTSQWFRTEMPLLAAPEYGLSQQIQKQLLKILPEIGDASRKFPDDWSAFRQESFRAAKSFEHGQAPADWFTVRLNYRDKDISEPERVKTLDERVRALETEICNTFQDSPWCRALHGIKSV